MSKRRRNKPLPDPCEGVEIESLTHDGRGLAHRAGKVVFIDGALPGEIVDFEYLGTHRKFDEGRVTAVQRASADRVEPGCPHFGVCGGCSLQHLTATAQIRAKQEVLVDNLQRLGKVFPEEMLPPLTGPVWGYRARARLGVRHVTGKGRVLVGFRERRSSFIADLQGCAVLHPAIGEHLAELAGLIDRLEAKARIPQVEVAVTETETALVFRHLDALCDADLAGLREFAASRHLHIYLQPAGPDSVILLWPEHSRLSYTLPEWQVEIEFRPTDFTQVNPAINRQMVARALELLAVQQNDRILELFCGLGNFTLPLARQAGEVTAVEGDAALVSRARDNALRNGIHNVTFHTVDLAGDNIEAAWAGAAYDGVLLDPPRSGAAGVLDLVGNIRPARVVYVSCHPGSLARDAGRLVNEFGYRLRTAGVMDMFPHTAHVESIALFESDR